MIRHALILCTLAGVANAGSFDTAGWLAHVARLQVQAEADPRDAETPLRLAGGFAARGALEPALRWATLATERGAHPVRVHLVRAEAFVSAARPEDAVPDAFEATQLAPNNGAARLLLWRAIAAADRTKLDPALDLPRLLADMDRAGYHVPVEPQPDAGAADALSRRARGMLRAGDDARRTVEAWRAALRHAPSHADAWHGLGTSLALAGQADAALGAYRVFLYLSPRETHETRRARRLIDDAERRRGLDPPTRP